MNTNVKENSTMKIITTTDLQALLTETPDLYLIDVREIDEYAAGHIEQAINVPLSTFAENAEDLDKTKTVHVICAAGGRSMNASAYLDQLGFDVVNVDGGMMSWMGDIV